MTLEDKCNKNDDTEILVRRICPEFTFQGKQLWQAHIYLTTDVEREQRERYCPTHYEIKTRYDKRVKDEGC